MKVLIIFVVLGFLAASAKKVTVWNEFGVATDYCECPAKQEFPASVSLNTYEDEVGAEGLIKVYCWTYSSNCNNFDTSGESADMIKKSPATCCRKGAKSWMRHNYLDCYSC